MTDVLNLELYDPIALRELSEMADLMIAANATDHHLSQEDIDITLGLSHAVQLGA